MVNIRDRVELNSIPNPSKAIGMERGSADEDARDKRSEDSTKGF